MSDSLVLCSFQHGSYFGAYVSRLNSEFELCCLVFSYSSRISFLLCFIRRSSSSGWEVNNTQLQESHYLINMAMVIPSTLLNSDILMSKWTCCSVAKSCQTLHNPTDCSPSGSSVLGILQARILERVIIPFSRGIVPTQGSKPGLLYCRQILYQLSHQESTYYLLEFAQIHIHCVADAL